ncbi:uncharacterized protein EI90DRAFT_2000297 [Cantharellus anzutake]|uniref:uncharacterized protein n=1 Tax=Cantharellus anzutake TaxID=1750568 RepID=UPI0019034834|nr:uncharacterized protein EI90DRAFT_2000297 [Cantharellus anzutake]KAF8326127.1 hypothetical protein EI90DRAFT_2000297 [Cantharellus anzutake]
MDEVDSDRIIEQRFRTRALKQSAFSRNLEMLKERQAKRREQFRHAGLGRKRKNDPSLPLPAFQIV